MQKELNSQVKDMKWDSKKSSQSFLNHGRKFRSNKGQNCLVNSYTCAHCFAWGVEGHIAGR